MRVNPYIEPLLQNAIGLLNEPAVDAADLYRRWLEHGMPAQHPPDDGDAAIVSQYLAGWTAVVDADDQQRRVETLNILLDTWTAAPSITDHDGSGWHVHYRDPAAGFGHTLAGATSAAAAQFLTERGMQRIGRCVLDECRRAFLDTSPPGRRRYCSHPCANRDAVRRYRRRRP